MRKVTKEERDRINQYFNETGWQLEKDVDVLVIDTLDEVVKYLGENPKKRTEEEKEDIVDRHGNVWFDSEKTSSYYVIVQ